MDRLRGPSWSTWDEDDEDADDPQERGGDGNFPPSARPAGAVDKLPGAGAAPSRPSPRATLRPPGGAPGDALGERPDAPHRWEWGEDGLAVAAPVVMLGLVCLMLQLLLVRMVRMVGWWGWWLLEKSWFMVLGKSWS